MKKLGVDVSRWNGNIDFKRAKSAGVEFAILRVVSEANGGYIDPNFERYYKQCKEAGVPVGAYVASYCLPQKSIPLVERALKGKQLEYPLYYDVEDFSFQGWGSKSGSRVTQATVDFCSHFEKKGFYVGVYSNKAFYDRWLDKKRVGRYAVWIAHWNKNVNYQGVYGMHQFTNQARFAGMPNTSEGGVDANWAFVDYPGVIKRLGFNGFPRQVVPAEPKQETVHGKSYDHDYAVVYASDGDLANAQVLFDMLGSNVILSKTEDATGISARTIIQVGGRAVKGADVVLAGKNREMTLHAISDYVKELK